MSTTQSETGIVRIRVGLLNDILRFNHDLCTIFVYSKSISDDLCFCLSPCARSGESSTDARSRGNGQKFYVPMYD